MSLFRNILFISVPTFFVVVLFVEIFLRVSGYTPFYLNAEAFIRSRNPEVVYELRPDFKGLYAGVPIIINSSGFRGRELSTEKRTRVLLLGDSVAFSQGVPEGETLADQLAAHLNGKAGTPVEVVNSGVPGWNSCQEFAFFQSHFFEAQAAILIYVDNDTEPPNVQVQGDRIITSDVRLGPLGDVMAWLRISSFSYNYVWSHWQIIKTIVSSPTLDQYAQLLSRRFDDSNPGWRASRACLVGIARLARAHSIRLIVLPFPQLFGLSQMPFPFRAYIDTICAVAKSAGAECLDVVPSLQVAELRLWVSVVERHPSAEVHAKMADQIQRMLNNVYPHREN